MPKLIPDRDAFRLASSVARILSSCKQILQILSLSFSLSLSLSLFLSLVCLRAAKALTVHTQNRLRWRAPELLISGPRTLACEGGDDEATRQAVAPSSRLAFSIRLPNMHSVI